MVRRVGSGSFSDREDPCRRNSLEGGEPSPLWNTLILCMIRFNWDGLHDRISCPTPSLRNGSVDRVGRERFWSCESGSFTELHVDIRFDLAQPKSVAHTEKRQQQQSPRNRVVLRPHGQFAVAVVNLERRT